MRRSFVSAVVALLVAVPVGTAAAQAASSVTLSASAPEIAYGQTVMLSGTIDLPSAGQSVQLLDETETVLATATTDADGAFAAELAPDRSIDVHAAWGAAVSDPVHVDVGAVVTANLSAVRLFGRATVRGTVSPARPGESVEVTLTHAGDVVATRHPEIGSNGGFRTSFRIADPGAYRARAAFSATDLLRGTALDGPTSPPLPSLKEASRGVFVKLLEQRLVELRYRLVGIDRKYDFRTSDAVVAFRKVQGMTRTFAVDAAVWRALADPRRPRPESTANGFHIEVDQPRQVLYTVEDGQITNVIHVSTGKPSTPTRDGAFRVYRKLAGYSGNRLYYPSYFDGLRAIHGWTEVPTYAASHGCVRVPYWHAKWIFGLARLGTRILVYH